MYLERGSDGFEGMVMVQMTFSWVYLFLRFLPWVLLPRESYIYRTGRSSTALVSNAPLKERISAGLRQSTCSDYKRARRQKLYNNPARVEMNCVRYSRLWSYIVSIPRLRTPTQFRGSSTSSSG